MFGDKKECIFGIGIAIESPFSFVCARQSAATTTELGWWWGEYIIIVVVILGVWISLSCVWIGFG